MRGLGFSIGQNPSPAELGSATSPYGGKEGAVSYTNETPADAIDLVACDDSGRYRVRTPKLPISFNGAGDAIAALFFAHHLRSDSAAEALSRAASSIFGILRRTAEAGSREILLIDAQDELVNPSAIFRAEPL